VPEPRILKILLVEDDPEDAQLLGEAFSEIEENRQWCNWRTSSVVQVEQLGDAIDCLRQGCLNNDTFDIVLLNLSLPDSPALLDSFLDINANAGGVPIVVLADEADEDLANRLLREGAQDILVKPELECALLARSIRYAVERQRRASALRASAFVDDLTGTLTHDGFLTVAAHYARLSVCGRMQLLLALVEVSADRDAREPLLIRVAEVFGRAFEGPAIIGRWDRCRFCVITAGLTATTVEAMLHRAAAKVAAAEIRFSVTPLDPRANLEEVLAGELRAHPKTAILAD
jgi:DNA-binding response OmpR family regulator